MAVQELQPGQYADLFAPAAGEQQPITKQAGFGTSNNQVDLFQQSSATETTTIAPASTEETTTIAPEGSVTETTTIVDLFEGASVTETTTIAADFKDMYSYIEDRIKAGKFVNLVIEDETGAETPFIPKTPEEFDRVFDLQIESVVDKKKNEINEGWYNSKSPAWKAVAQYAEMTDDPTEVIPFLQGMRNIESIKDVDPKEIEGAEVIVRAALEQQGLAPEMVDQSIETLKTTAQLVPSAEKYKPALLKQETARMQQLIQQRQVEQQEYTKLVNSIREESTKVLEQPIFGKQKLKGEEKLAIYNLISEPTEGGYAIYDEIDKLYETKDFEKLRKIALLLAKEEAFVKYISVNAADKTHKELEVRIKAANENRGSSANTNGEQERVVIKKTTYGTPSFGKYPGK